MHAPFAPRLAVATAMLLGGATLLVAPALAADGDQDPAFGVAGVFGPRYGQLVRDAATLPNQDIAVVGSLTISSDPLVDWLYVTGDGHAIVECGQSIPFLASFMGNAVIADRSGRLLVGGTATLAGSTGQDRALLVRYSLGGQCGSLDSSWSGNGWQLLDPQGLCASADCSLADVAEAPTNTPNLFALVESKVNLFVSRYFVAAFLNGGDIDTGFGTSGYAEVTATGIGTLESGGAHLAIDPKGRPMVLATRFDPNQSLDADPVLLRFTAAGALDTTFESGGIKVLHDDPQIDEVGVALAIASDGTPYAEVNSISPDHTGWILGRGPGAWMGVGNGAEPLAALVLQGDGKVLTVGNSTSFDGFEVTRLIPTPAFFVWDESFTGDGIEGYDVNLGGANGQQAVVMVLSGGRPVMLGNADTSIGEALFAIRLKNRYLFADSFEVGAKSRWSASFH